MGELKTHFIYKLARLVKKHGRHRPMYFRNGQGLEMIGHNSHTLCPIVTKLGGDVHNWTGNLPPKACEAQPIGGDINATCAYLKDCWTEFHQIWSLFAFY